MSKYEWKPREDNFECAHNAFYSTLNRSRLIWNDSLCDAVLFYLEMFYGMLGVMLLHLWVVLEDWSSLPVIGQVYRQGNHISLENGNFHRHFSINGFMPFNYISPFGFRLASACMFPPRRFISKFSQSSYKYILNSLKQVSIPAGNCTFITIPCKWFFFGSIKQRSTCDGPQGTSITQIRMLRVAITMDGDHQD